MNITSGKILQEETVLEATNLGPFAISILNIGILLGNKNFDMRLYDISQNDRILDQ